MEPKDFYQNLQTSNVYYMGCYDIDLNAYIMNQMIIIYLFWCGIIFNCMKLIVDEVFP